MKKKINQLLNASINENTPASTSFLSVFVFQKTSVTNHENLLMMKAARLLKGNFTF